MLNALINLIYPKVCYSCGKSIHTNLKNICLLCRTELPRVYNYSESRSALEQTFWGRLEIEKASAYLKFEKKGKVQQLLYVLKYRGIKEVGESLGEMAALELNEIGFFEDIDYLVPVPIHPLKKRKRGYNQSDFIAYGIEKITGLNTLTDCIEKIVNTSSQTRKSRFQRFKNVDRVFEVKQADQLRNKHILLIDDVITTGSTIEACGNELKKIEGLRLSILTIAFTY